MPVTRILHNAGNISVGQRTPESTPQSAAANIDALRMLARHPAVDAIEADVWVHGGVLLAHHERPLGPLPFLLGRGGFRRRSDAPLLATIIESTAGQADLVIDLRSWLGDPVPDLARVLRNNEVRAHTRVTCEDWSIADQVQAWMPDVPVAYSIRSEAHLRAYLAGRDAGRLPETAVAIRHTLLHTPDEVALLRERAGRINAWTVDDTDRALELVSWGIDEITSNYVTVLNAL